ncbi:MAG: SlyX family protein [Spirochaetaceae bacterium]|nr:SlyX family protein [Spirochaetaceae bacterium]
MDRLQNNDSRLIALEMKVSYLEDFLLKLQNASVEQGNLLERLTTENRLIRNKITEISEQLEGDIPNLRPPHY